MKFYLSWQINFSKTPAISNKLFKLGFTLILSLDWNFFRRKILFIKSNFQSFSICCQIRIITNYKQLAILDLKKISQNEDLKECFSKISHEIMNSYLSNGFEYERYFKEKCLIKIKKMILRKAFRYLIFLTNPISFLLN